MDPPQPPDRVDLPPDQQAFRRHRQRGRTDEQIARFASYGDQIRALTAERDGLAKANELLTAALHATVARSPPPSRPSSAERRLERDLRHSDDALADERARIDRMERRAQDAERRHEAALADLRRTHEREYNALHTRHEALIQQAANAADTATRGADAQILLAADARIRAFHLEATITSLRQTLARPAEARPQPASAASPSGGMDGPPCAHHTAAPSVSPQPSGGDLLAQLNALHPLPPPGSGLAPARPSASPPRSFHSAPCLSGHPTAVRPLARLPSPPGQPTRSPTHSPAPSSSGSSTPAGSRQRVRQRSPSLQRQPGRRAFDSSSPLPVGATGPVTPTLSPAPFSPSPPGRGRP